MQRHLDVLPVEPGELRDDLHLLLRLRLADIDMRPAAGPAEAGRQRQVEAAEEIVEEPVHLAMEREERAVLVLEPGRRRRTAAAPRNEITHGHASPPFINTSSARGSSGDRAEADAAAKPFASNR